MNEVVPVFGNVGGDRSGGVPAYLRPETIRKVIVVNAFLDVGVCGKKCFRKIAKMCCSRVDSSKGGREEVAMQVASHVPSACMVGYHPIATVPIPLRKYLGATCISHGFSAGHQVLLLHLDQSTADFFDGFR